MEMSLATLKGLVESDDVARLAYEELQRLVREQKGISQFVPDGMCQIDPRNGDRILYNTARARRPHDNRPQETAGAQAASCVICEGKTTGVLDYRTLSTGFTFINKNLFPMLFPSGEQQACDCSNAPLSSKGLPAAGLHLLQWTSSVHDADFHNMPLGDLAVVVERLGVLEESLLKSAHDGMPGNETWGDDSVYRGYVGIIKNYGRLVGGSLAHGHQQIAYSNVMPRKFADNLNVERKHGKKFTQYLLPENDAALVVREYDHAVLLVPYFMKRPFEMYLVMKDTRKRYIHQLTEAEQRDVAHGWSEAIAAILDIMPRVGREPAYNVVTHTGPGAGLYFEFLPYTQETGGYEHQGLFICQGNPPDSAKQLREVVAGLSKAGKQSTMVEAA